MSKRSQRRLKQGHCPIRALRAVGKRIPRRDFVRATGGLLAVAAVGDACLRGEEPGPTGLVRVTITGLGPEITTAGNATITPIDAPGAIEVTIELPPIASGEETVPVGTYHVEYTPPTGYVIATGSTGSFDVAIVENQVTEVTVAVAPAAVATGTLRITVNGIDADAANGGSASVLRTDIGGQTPVAVNIPKAGTVDTAFVPGMYSVTYTPPSGHQLTGGQSNPQSIAVTASQTSTATFQVALTGTLRITVTGLDAGAANGGSASVLRTDIGGQTPVTVNVPAAGTLDTAFVVGTYSVTYTPPSGHQLSSGQTNPQSATINAVQTATVTFQVEAAPVPVGVVFHSDWSTALGTSDAALRDTEKDLPWSTMVGNGSTSGVVAATGLDFPSTNVYRVQADYSANAAQHVYSRQVWLRQGIPVPNVGGSVFYRWYWRCAVPDAIGNGLGPGGNHPIENGPGAGTYNWMFLQQINSNGTFIPEFRPTVAPYPNNRWVLQASLNKNQTYRFELHILRTGATTFNMHVRVYGADNVLLHDDADFSNATGALDLSSTPSLPFNDVNLMNQLAAGTNGPSWDVTPEQCPFVMFYQGCFAVRTDDWCGPYSGGI